MLEKIKVFLFGKIPDPDDNYIYYGPEEPEARGGLLRYPQLVKGDIWVDTSNNNTTYWFDGKLWNRVTS